MIKQLLIIIFAVFVVALIYSGTTCFKLLDYPNPAGLGKQLLGATSCSVLSSVGLIAYPVTFPFTSAKTNSLKEDANKTLSQVSLSNIQEEGPNLIEQKFGSASADLAGKTYRSTQFIFNFDMFVPRTVSYQVNSDFESMGMNETEVDGKNNGHAGYAKLTEGVHKVRVIFTNPDCLSKESKDYAEQRYSFSTAKIREVALYVSLEDSRNYVLPRKITIKTKPYLGKDFFMHCKDYSGQLY